jgi:hypothetical protein
MLEFTHTVHFCRNVTFVRARRGNEARSLVAVAILKNKTERSGK